MIAYAIVDKNDPPWSNQLILTFRGFLVCEDLRRSWLGRPILYGLRSTSLNELSLLIRKLRLIPTTRLPEYNLCRKARIEFEAVRGYPKPLHFRVKLSYRSPKPRPVQDFSGGVVPGLVDRRNPGVSDVGLSRRIWLFIPSKE